MSPGSGNRVTTMSELIYELKRCFETMTSIIIAQIGNDDEVYNLVYDILYVIYFAVKCVSLHIYTLQTW